MRSFFWLSSRTCRRAREFISHSLSGTVIDPSGLSIPSASVDLFLPGGARPILSTTTTAEGLFAFSSIPPGTVDLVVTAAGFRKYVEENADYVGPKFPEEARKIHYGEAEERHIYGESTLKEAKDLIEEGIAVAPLPPKPDEMN